MYNRNYGGFDFVRIHSELLTLVHKTKIFANLPVTDGYTKPLALMLSNLYKYYDMKNKNLGKNIAFGMLLGVIVGILLKSIGLWISLGMLFGVVRANLISPKENKE